jgi:hypothetical protein
MIVPWKRKDPDQPPNAGNMGARMGRGKQKAKHAKVARELKYQTVATDFAALQRELSQVGSTGSGQLIGDPSKADADDDGSGQPS